MHEWRPQDGKNTKMAEKSVINRSVTVWERRMLQYWCSPCIVSKKKQSPTSRYERKHAIGAQQNSRHDVHHRALCVDTIMYCTCTNKHKQSCTVSVSRSNECRSNYQFSGPDSNRNVIHWQHTHTHTRGISCHVQAPSCLASAT